MCFQYYYCICDNSCRKPLASPEGVKPEKRPQVMSFEFTSSSGTKASDTWLNNEANVEVPKYIHMKTTVKKMVVQEVGLHGGPALTVNERLMKFHYQARNLIA